MTTRIADYTYTLERIERQIDSRGQVKREKTKVYEAYPAYRRNVLILLTENGVPRSAEQIAGERRRAANDWAGEEARAARENRLDSGTQSSSQRFFSFAVGSRSFSLAPTNFLISHEFFAPRQVLFNHRKAILLQFRPRPDLTASDGSSRVLGRLAGRVWIDALDKVTMRLEAFPLAEISVVPDVSALMNAANVNAPFTFEFLRLPNGTWVTSLLHLNTYGREGVFENERFSLTLKYRDHKLFSTNVEYKLDSPNP